MLGPSGSFFFFLFFKDENITHYTRHMHAWQTAHAPQLDDCIPQACPAVAKAVQFL